MPGCLLIALLLALMALAPPVRAQELRTYTKKGSFEDVKLDLADAVTRRGLVIDFTGNVGRMLERTGKEVGSTKPIYRHAEYVSFCSAVLSRQLMEADPGNLAYCPFVLFAYEAAGKPGEVVVGYRSIPASGSSETRKALAAVEALLDAIAKEATR